MNVKPVKGDAARYLAKYMSKGRQQVGEAQGDWGSDVCPKTWWNMSKCARELVKAETYRGRDAGAILDATLEHAWLTDIDAHYAFLRPITMEFDGVEVTVGWRGRFQDDIREDVKTMLESVSRHRFDDN